MSSEDFDEWMSVYMLMLHDSLGFSIDSYLNSFSRLDLLKTTVIHHYTDLEYVTVVNLMYCVS